MLQTNRRNQIILYNPDQLSRTELINNFIVRLKEFEEIFRLIKTDKMKNPSQHIIVQGQRGMGKTMLLKRLYYAIKDDGKLNKNIIPIIFNEEEYGIRRLSKLWEHIADYLENTDDSFLGLVDEMKNTSDASNYEEECFELLISNLKKGKKKLLLFIDNFGDMVKKFKPKELQRLREVLLTSSDLRIIAGSAVVLEFSYDYSHPFYEFFKVFHLKGLTKNDTIKLLLQLGELYNANEVKDVIKNEMGRIEALRRLTNGVPRTIALLFEIFLDSLNGDSFKDLEIVLDRVTPLYKHRMDELPPQQQEIMNVIALSWDAITVKEIVRETGLESKAVSAQLSLLERNNVINKEKTNTKNHLYLLSERFFNIWYLMRYGNKKSQNRVKFLTRFLEIWCSSSELLNRTNTHIEALTKGGVYDKYALFMTEALANTSISIVDQDKLIKKAEEYYLKGIEKGNFIAMSNLALLFLNRKERKEEALVYSKKSVAVNKEFLNLNTFALVLLWNDEIEEAVKIWEKELFTLENIEEWTDNISKIFIFFISKKQYSFVYNIFQENKFNIKERVKPIYYALLNFMGDKYEDEARKMGSELKETVDEIIATIKQFEKDYS